MTDPESTNRLGESKSPYLAQHADNPVHWQPWDDAAWALARERDVPVMLSIGYSSCHWCHVMAHESFEDPDTAAVLNRSFVSIKVDREERPDIDRVYQAAHQVLTRQGGGWPLTVFLDPVDRMPFFSGTYFPRTPRMGMPSFLELLGRVASAWSEQRDSLREQAGKLQQIFDALNELQPEGDGTDASALMQRARDDLAGAFDASDGGFGGAPKFPMPTCIERLLRHWARSRDAGSADGDALEMAMHTLTRMARGGIFDHLGGGFCRYSTDAKWLVPHFEKMLYDNGALLAVYADALRIAPDPLLESTVRDTAGWLLREMQASDGGFHAALDADSEGREGAYYTWHREQVRRQLDPDEYELIATLYGIGKPANFEDTWILHRRDSWRSVVERLQLEPSEATKRLARARDKLLAARSQRERPGRDDKILVAWNGLAIRGLARANVALNDPAWERAATRALDFIRDTMVEDGHLHTSWIDGQLGARAFLDDHALLLDACLELLRLRWRDVDVRFAEFLGDALIERFLDGERGGFYHTAHDAEALIFRPKPTLDESTPSGNGVAARALLELGHLLGRTDFVDAAERTLAWSQPSMQRAPHAHSALCDALEIRQEGIEQMLIRGPDAEAWARDARREYRPEREVFAIPDGLLPAPGHDAPRLPDWLPEAEPGETLAWICRQGTCSLPIRNRSAFGGEIGDSKVVAFRPRGS